MFDVKISSIFTSCCCKALNIFPIEKKNVSLLKISISSTKYSIFIYFFLISEENMKIQLENEKLQ